MSKNLDSITQMYSDRRISKRTNMTEEMIVAYYDERSRLPRSHAPGSPNVSLTGRNPSKAGAGSQGGLVAGACGVSSVIAAGGLMGFTRINDNDSTWAVGARKCEVLSKLRLEVILNRWTGAGVRNSDGSGDHGGVQQS